LRYDYRSAAEKKEILIPASFLQTQKRELIDSVIQSGGESVTALSKEELMRLLDI